MLGMGLEHRDHMKRVWVKYRAGGMGSGEGMPLSSCTCGSDSGVERSIGRVGPYPPPPYFREHKVMSRDFLGC